MKTVCVYSVTPQQDI
jgi:multidrug efflux pump subunit AcrB